MGGELKDGVIPGLEGLAHQRVDIPRFISQGNGYDCVPATLVNTAQLMGYALVDTQRENLDLESLRKALGWPLAPSFVDVHSISPVLNNLPRIVEGKLNSALSAVKIYGGDRASFLHGASGQTLSQETFSTQLYGQVRKGQGVILGFGDHASVWAPVKITSDDIELLHIDSRIPQSPLLHWQQFDQYLRENSPYASPNGEHPVLFQLNTSRMLRSRQSANIGR